MFHFFKRGASNNAPPPWLRAVATLIVLAGAVWAIYGRAIHAPLIYDDSLSVIRNPSIVRLWPLIGEFDAPGPLNPPPGRATCGRPLVNFTFALNYHFGGLDPAGYHVVNIILHILSAALLAGVVGRTLRLDHFERRFEHAAWPLSLGVALLWAVHPLNTESVIYVTQRTELMVGFFYLATLYASLRHWTATSQAARIAWLVVATLACLAGMTSKELMVTAPVAVLLYQRTFLTGSFEQALRKSWPLYLGLAMAWLLLWWLNVDGPRGRAAGFDLRIAPHVWWFTQAKVLFIYLKLAVWPWPLVIHYATPLVRTLGEAWPWLISATLLAIATLILLWRNTAAGFLMATVWLALAPTLVVPIVTEIAAERRMYLALAALVTLVIVGGYSVLTRQGQAVGKGRLAVGAVALVALVVGLSLISIHRLGYYNAELLLWQDAQVHQPHDHYIACVVGYFLNEAARPAEAIPQYERALELKPNSALAHNGLGAALFELDRTEAAIEHLRQAVAIAPANSTAHYDLGRALARSGQTDEAIEHLRQGLGVVNKHAEARNELGAALVKVGRAQEAAPFLQEAVALKRDFAEAWFSLAQAQDQRGAPGEAVAAAEKALELARSQAKMDLARQIETWLAVHRPQSTETPIAPASGTPQPTP